MATVTTGTTPSPPPEDHNGLICFTNCLLPQEGGSLAEHDLWVDERRGVILDAHNTFFNRKERPDTVINLGGNILSPGLIDMQINGAYNFDFSEFDGNGDTYRAGLDMVARRIVETGVTSLLPTVITSSAEVYPNLLSLLRPYTPAPTSTSGGGATLLGWHAEGPFLQPLKRGAHSQALLRSSHNGFSDLQDVYGEENLLVKEDWDMSFSKDASEGAAAGVRMVTLAPELPGSLDSTIPTLCARGIVVSIGHSIASSDVATRAIRRGAKAITHLFNAMPQLHHRDPGIIGLLGASPASLVSTVPSSFVGSEKVPSTPTTPSSPAFRAYNGTSTGSGVGRAFTVGLASIQSKMSESATPSILENMTSEAFDDLETPPHTPQFRAFPYSLSRNSSLKSKRAEGPLATPTKLDLNASASNEEIGVQAVPGMTVGKNMEDVPDAKPRDERPFYGLIVDGVHSHPNSVRLAYTAHQDGCILITDAMKILDPSIPDGPHSWRTGGPRFIKEGVRLYVEGSPDTLAGSVVTLDACVRNFMRFTGCGIGEALRCATFNPATCLGIQNRKGTLRAGADADLAVLDKQGNVLSTWVRGRQVWKKE